MEKIKSVYILFFGAMLCSMPKAIAQPEIKQIKNSIRILSSSQDKEKLLDSLFFSYKTSEKSKELQSAVYYQLGHQYFQISNADKSEKSLQQAILLAEEDPLLVGKAQWKLGELWIFQKNNPDSAIYHLQRAREYLQKDNTAAHQKYHTRTLRELSLAYTQTGEFELAHHFLQHAYKQYEAAKDTNNMASIRSRLGLLAFERERWEESLVELKQSETLYLSLPETVLKRKLPLLWNVKVNIANAYLKKGDLDIALQKYQAILDIVPLDSWHAQLSQMNIGIIFRRKKQYDKAINYLNLALKTEKGRQEEATQAASYAPIYDNLADTYRDKGDLQRALTYHQTSIQQLVPQFRTEKDLKKNPDFTRMTVQGWMVDLLIYLPSKANIFKLLYEETGDKNDLQAALQTYQSADVLVDLMRFQHQEENSKLFWRKTSRPLYEKAIETAFLLEDAEAALYFLEKSKAALLADALNDRHAREKTKLPQEKLAKIKELKAAIYQAEQDDNRPSFLQLKDELEGLITSLEKDFPAYYQFKYNRKVPDLTTLRRDLLDDSTAFIGYFVGDTVIYSLQVTKSESRLDKLIYTQKERQDWHQMLAWAAKENLYDTKNKVAFFTINKNLTDKIWKPLSPNTKRYLIAPDGWLNYLNFEMLTSQQRIANSQQRSAPTANSEASQQPAIFLIQNNTFSYTWSATVSQYVCQAKSKASNQFLGIAPVDFHTIPDSIKLNPLENSLKELAAIQKIITGESLTKKKATFQILQAALQKDWRIIHWATHAQADGEEPFIALYNQKIPLSQIYQLDLSNTELVTLSACESSLGEWQAGEGVASLSRACIFAGAQSVVASQWTVNDKATADLMGLFYENLAQGFAKDEALRHAKLEMLEESVPPAHWAAFVLVGNAERMVGLEGAMYLGWWFGAGVLLLLGMFFVGRKFLKN